MRNCELDDLKTTYKVRNKMRKYFAADKVTVTRMTFSFTLYQGWEFVLGFHVC